MNSSKAIEQLYIILKKNFGKTDAKNGVTSIIGNIIHDLEYEGLEVNEQNISDRLTQATSDFIKASKTEVA